MVKATERPTKPMIHSWFERMNSHIDTETRIKPRRRTAVRNIGQSVKTGSSHDA